MSTFEIVSVKHETDLQLMTRKRPGYLWVLGRDLMIALRAWFPSLSVFVGLAIAAAMAVYINAELVGRRFLEKRHMDWALSDLTQADLILTFVCAIAGGMLAIFLLARPIRWDTQLRLSLIMGCANLVLLAVAVWATIFARATLALWVQELHPIGLAQELMIAFATLLLVRSSWQARAVASTAILRIPGAMVIAAMAAALFLLLMEETSWGQHIFGWAAPEAFSSNLQQETNLHNFYTNRFEFLYYTGAFGAFLVLPFLAQRTRLVHLIGFYIPPAGFALAAIPIAGFMSEDWGIVFFRIYFFCALGLAAHASIKTRGMLRYLAGSLLVTMILSQFVFIAYGHQLVLSSEIGEMRETAIAWVILVYTVWLTLRLESHRTRQAIS